MATKTGAPKKPRSRSKPKCIWRLVTNHQNMYYMLAAGMVMGPAGFRGKHYSDPLSVCPGWIPLFRDKDGIPSGALAHATSERKHLLPCIASFDLSDLSGPVRVLSRDGRIRNVTKPPVRRRNNGIPILIRAPLPLNLLSGISFRSSEDKQTFENNARDVSNVVLPSELNKVDEALFSTVMDVAWPPVQRQRQLFDVDAPPAWGQALGGMFAMLYHTADRSDLGLAAYRSVTGAVRDKDSALVKSDPILAELPDWMDGGEISGQAGTRARLFWGVVQSLVDARKNERTETPVDVALEYLDSQLHQLQEMEFRACLERLIADMRSCLGLGGGTVTELLERHKGSLSRPLLLFCLREHCTDLLEFSHSILSEVEYLLAGILFGARDSWLQLPRALRDPDLSAFVAYRMADAEHRKLSDDFTLAESRRPSPPVARQIASGISKKLVSAKEIGEKANGNDSSCG
ncbi:MAG: hypothetical protein OXE42_07210 [Gammaproteobacteria bacterium]|nr:hypothetical protein [Gammaproteobacteria bacterium]